jgi:hypothetical protein
MRLIDVSHTVAVPEPGSKFFAAPVKVKGFGTLSGAGVCGG